MVLTKTCERCGDSLVIETKVRGCTKPVLIEQFPTALIELDIGDGDSPMLYGLVAVPTNVTEEGWVVSQYTQLGQLVGHRLHRVHKCVTARAVFAVPSEAAERVEHVNELLAWPVAV